MVEHLNCYRLLKRVTHHDLRGARGLLGETDNRTSPVIIHRRILGAAVCRSDTAPPAEVRKDPGSKWEEEGWQGFR